MITISIFKITYHIRGFTSNVLNQARSDPASKKKVQRENPTTTSQTVPDMDVHKEHKVMRERERDT